MEITVSERVLPERRGEMQREDTHNRLSSSLYGTNQSAIVVVSSGGWLLKARNWLTANSGAPSFRSKPETSVRPIADGALQLYCLSFSRSLSQSLRSLSQPKWDQNQMQGSSETSQPVRWSSKTRSPDAHTSTLHATRLCRPKYAIRLSCS